MKLDSGLWSWVEDLPEVRNYTPPMKIVVYSCLFNNYDYVRNLTLFPGVFTVLFTDEELEIAGATTVKEYTDWKWIRRNGCHLFTDADFVIYHDLNLKLKTDPLTILRNTQLEQLGAVPHPRYFCEYDCSKDVPKDLPVGYGCFMDKFIIRKNTPEVLAFETLWNEHKNYTYAIWKSGIRPMVMVADKCFTENLHKTCKVPIIWGRSE